MDPTTGTGIGLNLQTLTPTLGVVGSIFALAIYMYFWSQKATKANGGASTRDVVNAVVAQEVERKRLADEGEKQTALLQKIALAQGTVVTGQEDARAALVKADANHCGLNAQHEGVWERTAAGVEALVAVQGQMAGCQANVEKAVLEGNEQHKAMIASLAALQDAWKKNRDALGSGLSAD